MADEQTSQASGDGQSSSSQSSQQTSGDTSQRANGSSQTSQGSQTQAATKPERPAWVGESHWDADKGAFKPEYETYVKERDTFYATEQSRRLTLPKTPADYKLEVRKTFQVPQGVEFKLDEMNSLLPQAQALMHEIDTGKVSGQDAFSRMIELQAAHEIAKVQNLKTAVDAEIGKLGATGTARVTAVQNFLAAQLGEPMAKHMATMLVTAQHVEGFEKLMAAFRSQGAGTFTPKHGEENVPGKIDPESAEYKRMTLSERLAYASKHQQPQTNGRA